MTKKEQIMQFADIFDTQRFCKEKHNVDEDVWYCKFATKHRYMNRTAAPRIRQQT